MSMRIRNNVASLNSLRHANKNFKNVTSSLEKLTSGQKINKGADGPAALVASERLRGQVVSTKQALDNAEVSISMIQTAEGALNEVSGILTKLRQLTIHAANEGINDPSMLEADQSEIENLLDSLDRIAQTTVFGKRRLLDGSNGANGTAIGEGIHFVSATTDTQASPEGGYEVEITQVATRTKARGSQKLDINNIGDGVTLIVAEGGKHAVLDTTKGELKEGIDKIKAQSESAPEILPPEKASANIRSMVVTQMKKIIKENSLNVDFFEDPNGLFVARHRDFGDKPTLSVTSSVDGVLSDKANVAKFGTQGKNVAGNIGGEIALGEGQFLAAVEGTRPQGLVIQFTKEPGFKEVPVFDENGREIGMRLEEETNEDLVGSPEEPRTEGYVHVSQNSLSFQTSISDEEQVKVSLANVRGNQLARGIANDSGFESLADLDVTSADGAKDAMRLVDKAVDEIAMIRADLGAFQRNALENNLENLRIAEENLVNAESVIRDADMAREMSKLTSDQILMSSSTAMLAQANQIPQSVLNLVAPGG